MFVPLFPFPVPIPLIGEQLLPPNWPALPCTACTAHQACSSFLLDKGKAIGSPLCRAAPEDAANSVPPPPIPLGHRAGGSKGAEVKAERFYFRPLRRGSRDQEVPGVSLPTFSTRESRPGHGAERPYIGERRGAKLLANRARGEAPKNWDTSRSRQSPCNSPGRSRPRC